MHQATLCFLVDGRKICLGLKKRGFGVNRWNGFGGKVKADESVEEAARREVAEEVGVLVNDLEKVAELNFFFPHHPDWNQTVHAYFSKQWIGQPREGEEMKPQWFEIEGLPFEQMWPDDYHWLPKVLAGLKLKSRFHFGEGDQVIDFEINEVNSF